MAKHSINMGHYIQFQDTRNLSIRSEHMECIIRKEREIELHPDNMNREEGFSLSISWKPLLQIMKEQKKAPFSNKEWLTLISTVPELSLLRDPPHYSCETNPATAISGSTNTPFHTPWYPIHYLLLHRVLLVVFSPTSKDCSLHCVANCRSLCNDYLTIHHHHELIPYQQGLYFPLVFWYL